MSLVTRVRVRCHADRLDAALIDGAGRSSSPELALRAQRLTSSAFRAMLATRLENAVGFPYASRYTSRLLSTTVVDAPAAITQLAGPAVRRLAATLRAADDAQPRGVALALRLVEDGASSLYVGPSIDDVLAALEAIEAAL
jgi:hypothetical protein